MVEQPVVDGNTDRSYVDWPAIFAGTVITSGSMIILTTFASGLGLSSISLDEGGDISAMWLVITALFAIISMVGSYMLGGYIAGRMRRPAGNSTRDELTVRDGLNGLAVWGLGTLISALFALSILSGGAKAIGNAAQTATEAAGSAIGGAAQGMGQLAGGIVSGTGSAAGGMLQGVGQAAAPTIEQMLPEGLKANPIDYFTETLLRHSEQETPAPYTQNAVDFSRQISAVLANLLSSGQITDDDKAWLVRQVTVQAGVSESDAQNRVNQTIERVQAIRTEAEKKLEDAQKQIAEVKEQANKSLEEAKTQAAEIAEKTRVAGILSAFLLAASALVAAVAAYIGAVRGGRHRDEGRIWGGLAYHK
ncbi:hypothetical protein DKP76_16355 [Falsochrobactrum shanghaiense]|uniref:PhnA-like protein n=1 Tax=Falsochrobactrum shanghaiense TaxID=2201899 RepID=A0A316JC24_9HYPH|nr:hypothetical protein [Falsochrobactrum shanghaiense]PWL16553.1 hypothetical protein DKP76_16355 [Falsochrobactrum shanghaiense]